jgi:hypothetical protein
VICAELDFEAVFMSRGTNERSNCGPDILSRTEEMASASILLLLSGSKVLYPLSVASCTYRAFGIRPQSHHLEDQCILETEPDTLATVRLRLGGV